MKNWLVSFLERCIPTGEVEALSVLMLITFACVCSVVLNVEKRKATTNNQHDVFLAQSNSVGVILMIVSGYVEMSMHWA